MSDFWGDPQHRKARSKHRCIWCGEGILAGDSYIYQAGKFEGDFQANHWHPECFHAADSEPFTFDDGFTPYDNERPRCDHQEATGETSSSQLDSPVART